MAKGSQGTSVKSWSLRRRWKALARSSAPGVKGGILNVELPDALLSDVFEE
jgi:hypothetical protein